MSVSLARHLTLSGQGLMVVMVTMVYRMFVEGRKEGREKERKEGGQ